MLPAYRGMCVHDGWLAYTHYTRCRHALCGVHLLRELTYFEELSEGQKAWARPLKEFFRFSFKGGDAQALYKH